VDRPPSLDEQRAFYDRWNSRARRADFDDLPQLIRHQGSTLIQRLRAINLSSASILEVGCGTGWLTERLGEFGRVTAIDLSPAAIEVARSRGIAAEFIAGDFYTHDFGTRSFDLALCVETLFYVPDPRRFLEKLASLIKAHGFLAITTINKFVFERIRDIPPAEPGQIRNWMTIAEVKRLLAAHFDVLSTTTVEPRGDAGVLRFVNSRKVNAVLERFWNRDSITRLKERIGLGAGVVMLARKAT
jgi:SAM-dependent methyltransferase